MDIKSIIYLRIKGSGQRQYILSNSLGYGKSALSSYLNGHMPLPYKSIEKLCGMLELGFFVDGEFVTGRGMFRRVIKSHIDKLGIPQYKFCKEVGINYSSLSSYLTEKRDCPLEKLQAILDYFGEEMQCKDKENI